MATLLEKSATHQEASKRPTREECIQDAGAAWARIRQMYLPSSDTHQKDAA